MVRTRKFLAVLLSLAMLLTQMCIVSFAVSDIATVSFSYPANADPTAITVKVSTGALSWTANDATNMAAPGPTEVNGTYMITDPGWYTLYSKGEGYYSVQTYFKVTADEIASGEDIVLPIENSPTAGLNNSDPKSTFLRLPPISDRQGAGNWTDDSKENTDNYFFALGSDVAPYTGPDYFQNPAFEEGRPFYQFTTPDEMESFIAELADECDDMYVYSMGTTQTEFANDLPLVIFTKADLSEAETIEEAGAILQKTGRPTYWHDANIHGNEQSSGEGALAMIYDLAGEYGQAMMEKVDVVVIPDINPDGHEVSTRSNVANEIDMNRDHLALEAYEVAVLHKAYSAILPELTMDGHELGAWSYRVNEADPDASYYNNADDMQSTPATSINDDPAVTEMAIEFALQQQQDAIDSGIRMMHYTSSGTTVNNSIGRAYNGLMGSVSFLAETRGQCGGLLKRRTYTQYMTSRSLLNSAFNHADELLETVAAARQNIIDMGMLYNENNRFVLKHDNNGTDSRLGAIQRYNLMFDGSYEAGALAEVNYAYTVGRDRSRPTGYVVPKGEEWVSTLLYILDNQGIEYYDIQPGAEIPLEQYYVTSDPSIAPTKSTYTADLRAEALVAFPNGAIAIPMDQVAGTVIAATMEPDVNDSAGYDGCFTQTLSDVYDIDLRGADDNLPIYRFTGDYPRDTFEALLDSEGVRLTTDAHLVRPDDYISLNASFYKERPSNTAILTFTYDSDKFEYAGFTAAAGVTAIDEKNEAGNTRITIMANSYDTKDFGTYYLHVKSDASLSNEYQNVDLNVEYVLKDEMGEKSIDSKATSASFTTFGSHEPGGGSSVLGDTNDDGIVDLIDLSNLIDWFGKTRTAPTWDEVYVFFDFNNDGQIGIYDVSYVARLI